YVTDSWQFLDDQFTWVERVRSCKVPKDVTNSFQRLYKIAKDNNVSFMDLCVYALGLAAGEAKIGDESPIAPKAPGVQIENVDEILRDLAAARRELQVGAGDPLARRRLALKYAKLAEKEIATSNYFRAGAFLQDAKTYIELNSVDQLRDPAD